MADLVVLLHGILRTKRSMATLASFLEKNGFDTLNITYPSRRLPIEKIADFVEKEITEHLNNNPCDRIHFIGHSMGGLIIRTLIDQCMESLPTLGRIVMLATPNHGSEVADTIGRLWPYKYVYGPAGQQLSTYYTKEVMDQLTFPKDIDLGIIAGTSWWLDPFSHLIMFNGPSDARVSVESTKLKGMKDHICLPVTHSFMMYNPKVKKQVLHFLKNGKFSV